MTIPPHDVELVEEATVRVECCDVTVVLSTLLVDGWLFVLGNPVCAVFWVVDLVVVWLCNGVVETYPVQSDPVGGALLGTA